MNTTELYNKYSSMTVFSDEIDIDYTLGGFFSMISGEIGVSPYEEFEDIAKSIDVDDEEQLAFLTFLYELYNTQGIDDYDDERIKFEFNKKTLFDGPVSELTETYKEYL